MASTTGPGISSEELRTFRYHHVVRKYGQVVMVMIYKACFLKNCSKSISEQLQDIEICNKTTKALERIGVSYKKWFTNLEFDKVDNNEPPESFDITLLFKICLRFWDNKVKEPSDLLKMLLKAVKDERNAVCHEDLKFTQRELRDKLEEFEKTLSEALTEAAQLYPIDGPAFTALSSDISKDIASIQEKIRENLDPLKPEDYRKLKEEIKSFADQLTKDIQERSVSDLVSIYERLSRLQPFDWLPQYTIIDPSDIMVSLEMDTDKALHAIQSEHQPVTVNQNEILTTKRPNGGDPEVVIISGDAGAGKTTLLCYLLEKWNKKETHIFSSLSSYDILLHMEFRSHDVNNFDDYLRDLLPDVVADYDFQNVKWAILKLRCLIICDGFDEKNERSMKLFKEILGLKSSGMKVIITTRPMNTSEVTDIVNRSKRQRLNLSLLGIPEEHQLSLITKLIYYLIPGNGKRKKILKKLSDAFNSLNFHMTELLKNPLYLSLYVVIWVECPDVRNSINTISKLFSILRKQISKRLKEKLETNGVVVQDEAILQFEHFYNYCSLRSHLKQHYELTDKDIKAFKEKCSEKGLPFDAVMSTYFSVKPSRKCLDIVNIWCYRHRSEQEFAAASAICSRILEIYRQKSVYDGNIICHILSSINHEMREAEECEGSESVSAGDEEEPNKKEIERMLIYLTGILNITDTKILGQYISDILDMVYINDSEEALILNPFLSHLSEAQNNRRVIKCTVNKLKHEVDKAWRIYGGKNLGSLPPLLFMIKPDLLLMFLFEDPVTLPGLIPSVRATTTHKVYLKLNLMGHWNKKTGYSDEILKEGGNYMLSFGGSITPEGVLLIPKEIISIDIHLSVKAIEVLSNYLPSLKKLLYLVLFIPFEETEGLSPLKFSKTHLGIDINLNEEGDSIAKQVAKMFNSLWPRTVNQDTTTPIEEHRHQLQSNETTLRCNESDVVSISNCHFTKVGVEELLGTLQMRKLDMIIIRGTINISEEEMIMLSWSSLPISDKGILFF